ncbi:MAG: GNAT family N-acetyltransferase [Muribaculaceae bacterium]|nr:GNAT family N-acetyltransferase [Muribaculaceae bacterium]
MIKIRKSTPDDIDGIMTCYEHARQYMRASGNDMQWINGYPSREVVESDIHSGVSYVGVDSDGNIEMAFAFILGDDPTYEVIENGAWLNDLPYGTIHRIGSTGKYRGMLKLCVDYCLSIIDNIRLDTHEVNFTMRNAAERLGFVPCGTIYCYDGTPRLAYQKYLSKQ